jgi:hypothetical protein
VLSVGAKTTRFLVVQGTGQRTAAATDTSYSGLQMLQIVTLNDFSANVRVANQ